MQRPDIHRRDMSLFLVLLGLAFGTQFVYYLAADARWSATGPDAATGEELRGGEAHGTVHVLGSSGREILYQGAEVWLRELSTGFESRRVETDCDGYYIVAANQGGSYQVCTTEVGYGVTCSDPFVMDGRNHYEPSLRLVPGGSGVVSGSVASLGGGVPAIDSPRFGEARNAVVTARDAQGTFERIVDINCGGEFVMALDDGVELVELTATFGGESVSGQGTVSQTEPVELVLPNSAPSIGATYLVRDSRPTRMPRPGDDLEVVVEFVDAQGDLPELRARAGSGARLGQTSVVATVEGGEARIEVSLPETPGITRVEFLLDDGRGGYAESFFDIDTGMGNRTFGGRVVDPSGAPIAAARVDIDGRETLTDLDGNFMIPIEEERDRYLVSIRAQGYALYSRAVNAVVPLTGYMLRPAATTAADPKGRIVVRDPGGAMLVIPPNALVDEKGNPPPGDLNVSVFTFDPADPTRQMPGGPIGIDEAGEIVRLNSYGAVDIEIWDPAGTSYDLAPGQTAQLRIPAPPIELARVFADGFETGDTSRWTVFSGAQQASRRGRTAAPLGLPVAPRELPETTGLWWYDEAVGFWRLEGEFQLEGTEYVGEVSHFSAFNVDSNMGTDSRCIRLVNQSNSEGLKLGLPYGVRVSWNDGGGIQVVEGLVADDIGGLQNIGTGINHFIEVVEVLGYGGTPTLGSTIIGPISVNLTGPSIPWADQDNYPYSACDPVVLALPVVLPTNPVDFLTKPVENDDREAAAYYSFIDPVSVAGPGTVTIDGLEGASSSTTIAGTAFSGFVENGHLIRSEPETFAGVEISCVLPAFCDTVSITLGSLAAGDLEPGDIVTEAGGQARIVEDFDAGTQEITLTSIFDPPISNVTFLRSEVRLVDSVSAVDLTVTEPFNHDHTAVTWERVGAKPNLDDWFVENHFTLPVPGGEDVEAAYWNFGDLGFDRWMFMKKGLLPDEIAYAVSNYFPPGSVPGDPAGNGMIKFINLFALPPDTNRVATVTMEYSRAPSGGSPYTKFYVYNGAGDRILNADLDNEGARSIPGLCIVCHAGNWDRMDSDGNLDDKAAFLPFDIESFRFPDATPTPYSAAGQETEFHDLNESICQRTNATDRVRELIGGWYDPLQMPCGTGALPVGPYDPAFVPPGFVGTAPNGYDTGLFYERSAKRACRACHSTRDGGLDWDSFSEMSIGGNAACTAKYMPHAKQTYRNFWLNDPPTPWLQTEEFVRAGLAAACDP